MQIEHRTSLAEKEAQVQAINDLHKYDLKIDQFITEALRLNSLLTHQKELLCQKISHQKSYCETSDKLTSQVVEMRLEYDEMFKKVSDFITWKNTLEGRKSDLPKLEESHKEILFGSWDSWLKEAEKATTDAATTTNIIIENINQNLHSSNIAEESIPRFLLDAKQLEQ